MRVVIAGAGSVGRSIARELIGNGHEVLLIDNDADDVQSSRVPDASWLLADACELTALHEAGLDTCDVCVAATGDDKANLVVSLLAKTEFGVPRTVARVNNPKNEWMFTEMWGVDVSVSTPHLLTALVEEAVNVGSLVRLLSLEGGRARLDEVTLAETSPAIGKEIREVGFPREAAVVAIVRAGHVVVPRLDTVLQANDEVLVLVSGDTDEADRSVKRALVG